MIGAAAAQGPGTTAGKGAAETDGVAVNRDQPKRKRLAANPRISFLSHDRGMSRVNRFGFTVVHALVRRIFWRLTGHFFASVAGAAAMMGDLASFKECDWSRDMR